jgi:ABC-type multidrug transport system ATPase subunit
VVDTDFRALSRLADRVLLMTKGELVFTGTPAALAAQPASLSRAAGEGGERGTREPGEGLLRIARSPSPASLADARSAPSPA